MNPFKLFLPSYLLDTTPGSSFLYFIPLLIFFVLIFVGSWQVKKMLTGSQNARINTDLLGSVPTRMREFALLGLLLTFFRNEDIPYLGMRIWLVLFFIAMLAYVVWIWTHYKKNFSVRIVEKESTSVTDKYLPTSKKKKKKKRS